MPQFLSATTTSASSVTTTTENAGTRVVVAGSPPQTISKADLGHHDGNEDGVKHRPYQSLHSRSKSMHQHHVDRRQEDEEEGLSSDGGVHGDGGYSDEEVVEDHNGQQHKNGYHLKISNMETVSRTPKEHFSDQVMIGLVYYIVEREPVF